MALLRPSIVGVALHEPFPGWVDSLAAAGVVILFHGIGLMVYLPGRNVVVDHIPVDYVSNAIIQVSAYAANQDDLVVYHNGTSGTNPFNTYQMSKFMHEAIKDSPYEQVVKEPMQKILLLPEAQFKCRFKMKYEVQKRVMGLLAKIVPSKQFKSDVRQYKRAVEKAYTASLMLQYFYSNEWTYKNPNYYKI